MLRFRRSVRSRPFSYAPGLSRHGATRRQEKSSVKHRIVFGQQPVHARPQIGFVSVVERAGPCIGALRPG
jgi:hypothetical protein